MHRPPLVVFPATLLASLAWTIAAQRDAREAVLHLFGVVRTDPRATLFIPLALVGHGVDRVRHRAACYSDHRAKLLEIEGFGARFPGTPRLLWTELGNVHRHPEGITRPSRGDAESARGSLAELPEALPALLVGILEPQEDGDMLRMFAIDRSGACAPVPWTTAALPTLATVSDDARPGWIDRPILRTILANHTGRSGTPDADGALQFSFGAGAQYAIPAERRRA